MIEIYTMLLIRFILYNIDCMIHTLATLCPETLLDQHHLEHKACSQKSGNVANVRSSR